MASSPGMQNKGVLLKKSHASSVTRLQSPVALDWNGICNWQLLRCGHSPLRQSMTMTSGSRSDNRSMSWTNPCLINGMNGPNKVTNTKRTNAISVGYPLRKVVAGALVRFTIWLSRMVGSVRRKTKFPPLTMLRSIWRQASFPKSKEMWKKK